MGNDGVYIGPIQHDPGLCWLGKCPGDYGCWCAPCERDIHPDHHEGHLQDARFVSGCPLCLEAREDGRSTPTPEEAREAYRLYGHGPQREDSETFRAAMRESGRGGQLRG